MDSEPDSGAWEVADFLDLYEQDMAAGTGRALSDYLSLFPVHQDLVAREYLARLGAATSATVPGSAASPLESGAGQIGPYRLVRELGRGGQGRVWLAEDVRLGRRVAIKVLHTIHGFRSEDLARRFRREAEIVSRLDHSGICTLYDVGTSGETTWIAMRHVEGESLAAGIAVARADPGSQAAALSSSGVRRAMALIERVSRALHAAHLARVVHRDIKPANIMVTPEGDPVILDFGLAKSHESGDGSLTRTDEVMGTPAYMAPEQLRGGTAPDQRTDVYALGITLYEAVTLHRPFEAPTHPLLYQMIETREPPDPRRLNPNVPRDLKVILETALQKERGRRYQTAEAFADDLRALLDGRPIAATPVSLAGRATRWARREPVRAALVIVLALGIPALASLATYWVGTRDKVRAAEAQERRDLIELALESGFSEIEEGSAEVALAAFRRALEIDPDNVEAVAGSALVHLTQRDPEAALEVLARHPGQAPSGGVLDPIRAEVLREAGREVEAAAVEAKMAEPSTALELFLAGTRKLRRGHAREDLEAWRRALDDFSQAVLCSPAARRLYYFEQAHAAGHARDHDAAERIAHALLQLWPHSPEALRWAAAAFEKVDPARSIGYFHRALEIAPDHDLAHYGLAFALRETGRLEEAVAACSRTLELRPGFGQAWFFRGTLFEALGRTEEAIEDYRRSSAARPDAWMPLSNLGVLLFKCGRKEEAVQVFRRAVALLPRAPKSARLYLNLGRVLVEMGDQEGATQACVEATGIDPELAEAWFELGCIGEERGDAEPALAAFRRAHELGSTKPGWSLPSQERITACEMLVRVDRRLAAILDGTGAPARAEEIGNLTELCRRKGMPLAEARLWQDVLERNPKMTGMAGQGHRAKAAKAAALAASGPGSGALSNGDRAMWRAQALVWLRAELAASEEALNAGRTTTDRLTQVLETWVSDPAFAVIRNPDSLAALPEVEREEWRAFWADVEALRRRIE